jgi:hypothetical protein
MATASVEASNDPAVWVAKALGLELSLLGYDVTEINSPAELGVDGIGVRVELLNIDSDVKPGLVSVKKIASLAVRVEVFDAQDVRYTRRYSGRYEDSSLLASGSSEMYGEMLNGALRNMLETAVSDLDRVLRDL